MGDVDEDLKPFRTIGDEGEDFTGVESIEMMDQRAYRFNIGKKKSKQQEQ